MKLKKYFKISKDEEEFIDYLNNDKGIYYDVEVIINGLKNNYNINLMDKDKNITSNIIERSDYSPINRNNFMELHNNLPKFNRLFVVNYNRKTNILSINNSLINDDFYEIELWWFL